MRKSNFDEILDSCLSRMQSGETVEQILADYPQLVGELRPLLQSAIPFKSAPRPTARPQAIQQGQTAMLAALADQNKVPASTPAVSFGAFRRYAERILSVLKNEVPPKEGASQMKLAFRSIVSTVLVLFVSGFFALAISANSLPGEPFYPIKRGWESARLNLTFDPDARQQLENQIQQNRQGELAALIELGRQTQIVYEGIVEQVSDTSLIVDGFVFDLNQETRLLIEPEIGQAVRIETEITADGRLLALEISPGSLNIEPLPQIIATPTPCNDPTCAPPTATPTPCNAGTCLPPTTTATLIPTNTPGSSTPTPCNTPNCVPQTATPTPTTCSAGACGNPTPTPMPTNTPNNDPTPTPCNTPACAPPTATPTPCNAGACTNPTPTSPPATSTPNNPTPTPCNTGACGNPSPTPIPSSTPNNPTPTPCNDPACAPPTPSPTPCNAGACGGSTPPPTNTPGDPTPTPCNNPTCSTPVPTPTICNAGACLPPTSTPGQN